MIYKTTLNFVFKKVACTSHFRLVKIMTTDMVCKKNPTPTSLPASTIGCHVYCTTSTSISY